jgi:O-antigen ligase
MLLNKGLESAVFYLSCLLLFAAPNYFAGQTANSLLFLECLGLVVLFLLFWTGLYSGKLYGFVWLLGGASCIAFGVYLIPIPQDLWQSLPGRELYQEVLLWLKGQGVAPNYVFLSLIPANTILSLLFLLPAVALFFSGVSLPERQVRFLIYVLLAAVFCQASLGVIQYSTGSPEWLFGIKSHGDSAQGLYKNRDHFVALMEMTLPLCIGMVLYCVGRSSFERQSTRLNQFILFSLLTILVLLAAVFSRSRAGIFIVIVMVLFSSIMFSRHIGGKQSVGITSFLLVVFAGIATSVGLVPVLNRFVVLNPVEDARWLIFETTINIGKQMYPWGSGPGTFSEVYRAYQPVEQTMFINHAHNDYLELFMEMGVLGVFVAVSLWLVYLFGWVKLRHRAWNRMHFFQVAAGLGVFALLLHAFVDFNFHTPANFIVFSFLLGVFLRREKSVKSKRRN